MRFIPFEIAFGYWGPDTTFQIQIIHFDWDSGDTCLLGGGWYLGDFWFDCCFWWAIKERIIPTIKDKYFDK